MNTLKIATRKSPLALWQAEHVKKRLQETHSDLTVELVSMTTEGDRFLDAPLVAVGGKGLFIKELETALLEGRPDIAVHSMKESAIDLPEETRPMAAGVFGMARMTGDAAPSTSS